MDSKVDYRVNSKENVYFYIRLLISLGLYYLIVKLILMSLKVTGPELMTVYMMYFYVFLIFVLLFFQLGLMIGNLKGNAIKLSINQFTDIYQIAQKQADMLGLKRIPSIYIMQSGGALNAFAAKFMGRNYIVLYSEIVETAYDQDKAILEFIMGHEMGHIKRNHMTKNLLLWPSYLIPFLGAAYSRACEYTCDNIGQVLCPTGVKSGLLVLASGKKIYKRVNLNEYLRQNISEDGFWKWFAEKVSSHPNLTRRLDALSDYKPSAISASRDALIEQLVPETVTVKKEDDHSRFFPQ